MFCFNNGNLKAEYPFPPALGCEFVCPPGYNETQSSSHYSSELFI